MLIYMEKAIMIITNIIWRHVLLISYTDCVGNYKVYSALIPVFPRLTLTSFEGRGLIYYPTARIQRKLYGGALQPVQIN